MFSHGKHEKRTKFQSTEHTLMYKVPECTAKICIIFKRNKKLKIDQTPKYLTDVILHSFTLAYIAEMKLRKICAHTDAYRIHVFVHVNNAKMSVYTFAELIRTLKT